MDVMSMAALQAAKKASDVMPTLAREQASIAYGGTIGTNGKAVIAFRCDDSTAFFKDQLAAEFFNRGFPVAMAMITNPASTHNTGVTSADIVSLNQKQGVQWLSHGYLHTVPLTREDLYREVVTSRGVLEGHGVKCSGWAQVGANGGLYGGIDSGKDPASWDIEAGRLIYSTYAHSFAYLGNTQRRLPSPGMGQTHVTVTSFPSGSSSAYLTTLLGILANVVKYGLSATFLIHPQMIGYSNENAPNWMNIADIRTFLDACVTYRDAGQAEVLTPVGVLYANKYTKQRLNFMEFGASFKNISSSNQGMWTSTTNWTDKTAVQVDATNDIWAIQIGNQFDSTNGLLTGTYSMGIDYSGETFLFRVSVKTLAAGTTQKIRIFISTNLGTLVDIQAGGTYREILATDTHKYVYIPVAIHPGASSMTFRIGRAGAAAGAGQTLEYKDIAFEKV